MAALIHQFHRELYPRSMQFVTAEHLSRGAVVVGGPLHVLRATLGWTSAHAPISHTMQRKQNCSPQSELFLLLRMMIKALK